MTANEYQETCMKYVNRTAMETKDSLLTYGVIGMNGEAGEAIDIVKKYLFQGHPLDENHLALELGDVLWYIAVSAKALSIDLETIMKMNIDKLVARYGDSFSVESSLHRAKDDI